MQAKISKQAEQIKFLDIDIFYLACLIYLPTLDAWVVVEALYASASYYFAASWLNITPAIRCTTLQNSFLSIPLPGDGKSG
tara:strand:+ start:279 stop:521 length:243 start_codon:yes stop_codon:yes gene_type:complete